MRYRVYFMDDRHPPVEVWCPAGTLMLTAATRLEAGTALLYFAAPISRIEDAQGRPYFSLPSAPDLSRR
jgi:hypothetical protein